MATSSSSSSSSLVPLVQSLQFKNGSLSKPTNNNSCQPIDTGEGEFVWPSGLRYVGAYCGRKRHGYGVQHWPDGARYEGSFHEDQRQGIGRHCWGNGEEYEGEYKGDKKHGTGLYRWPSGAFISGHFNQDSKDGHCVYMSADGERFEGLYRGDMRDGEGVLTYPGGRQDIGSWKGNKLIKLRFAVREALFNLSSTDRPSSQDSSLDSPQIKERGKFGPKGFLEVASEELFQAAACGDISKLNGLLKSGALYVDVADRNEHTPLFAASVNNQCGAIHVLLDHGADVNRLDSLGITALNACHHMLYSMLPQVKAVLKLLPSLEYPQLQSSPHLSSMLSDCTLHTSDFLSSPHLSLSTPHPSPLTPHNPHLTATSSVTCAECQGFCEIHSPLESDPIVKRESLPRVSSLPVITLNSAERKVQFVSLNDISKDCTDRTEVKTENSNVTGASHQLASTLHKALVPFVSKPVLKQSPESNTSPSVTPVPTTPVHISTTPNLNSPSPDSYMPRSTQQSYTASTDGDILGVSTLSPDIYSPSSPRLGNEPPSRMSLPQSTPVEQSTPDNGQDDPMAVLSRAPLATLHSSSVFSSSQYGPIVSAAQSTTLSCGSESLDNSSSLSTIPESTESLVTLPTTEATINLLLRRGASPNHSSLPLPPLLYAIRSGDTSAVQRLIEKGADINKPFPIEVGGHPPLTEALSLVGPNPLSVVDCLLKHGAQVNLNLDKSIGDSSSLDTSNKSCDSGTEGVLGTGDCNGGVQFSPLHTACSHREENEAQQEKLSETVLSMVELLLGAGGCVDVVACGHTPLSLAISNGHDKVVERLLDAGSDPNLSLGAGVGNALCALTTHTALKVRDQENTLKMLGLLLKCGASFNLPVLSQPTGTLADFAHSAFKEDKRLFHLKYHSLTKPERARHRAWHKILQTIVHLFRAKALQTIAIKEQAWLQTQIEQHADNRLQVKRDKMLRASSAMLAKSKLRNKRPRNTHSAGGVPSKTRPEILPWFPMHTMRTSLTKLTSLYGPSLNGQECLNPLSETGLGRGQEKRLRELKQLFDTSIAMFNTEHGDKVNGNSDSVKRWTLSCFCYECGRSAGVHLVPCPGCGSVYYCGHTCRVEGFKKGHHDECLGGFDSVRPVSGGKNHH